jgi:hypothetical protein
MRHLAMVAFAAGALLLGGCDTGSAAKGRPGIGAAGFVYHDAQPEDVPLMEHREDFEALMKAAAEGKQAPGALGRAVMLPANTQVTTLGFSPKFYHVRVAAGPAAGRDGWVAPGVVHLRKKGE